MAKKPVEKQEVETTGHEWDGIREYNNPMPRWWVWTFYATILWGIVYTILYPAWPISKDGATPGLLGWSTRANVAAEIDRFAEMNAELNAKLASVDLTALKDDPALANYAIQSGRAVFANSCSQCHGSGAAGSEGYPNLLDNDWLWGGDIETIRVSIAHGIRAAADDETRLGDMPGWGEVLEEPELAQVIEYTLSLAGRDYDTVLAEAGREVFADNCAACHGDNAEGMRELGAPSLTDAIWLFGSDRAAITETIVRGRAGVMPNWDDKLTESQIAAVAAYVHQLGGGE